MSAAVNPENRQMRNRSDSEDYQSIFVHDTPLLDLRAPVEFRRGAFPTASNIPLLDDDQRAQIGIRYHQAGQEQAIALGLQLATPDLRQQRMQQWRSFFQRYPEAYLYCFRGGLRSKTAQQWIQAQNIDCPLVRGGYKAMRQFLLSTLIKSAAQLPLVILSGFSGSGKTRLLQKISRQVNFEEIANHRGSAFGAYAEGQQLSPIDWENRLAIAFLKLHYRDARGAVFVEDEGRRIGQLSIPECLFKQMLQAPRALLVTKIEDRVQQILEEYILQAWPLYLKHYADSAELEFKRSILESLSRIQKRLGGVNYRQVKGCFEQASATFFNTGIADDFRDGIRILLEQYYDPMYRYQLAAKASNILFQGSADAYLEWSENYLREQSACN